MLNPDVGFPGWRYCAKSVWRSSSENASSLCADASIFLRISVSLRLAPSLSTMLFPSRDRQCSRRFRTATRMYLVVSSTKASFFWFGFQSISPCTVSIMKVSEGFLASKRGFHALRSPSLNDVDLISLVAWMFPQTLVASAIQYTSLSVHRWFLAEKWEPLDAFQRKTSGSSPGGGSSIVMQYTVLPSGMPTPHTTYAFFFSLAFCSAKRERKKLQRSVACSSQSPAPMSISSADVVHTSSPSTSTSCPPSCIFQSSMNGTSATYRASWSMRTSSFSPGVYAPCGAAWGVM
mmetsp:Transcript_14905/g.36021  ORF Transcript_14905/g.36021 Transcript_14905/m.36021 type:complete len:291 (+) Transcript_14905:275-1147(+)